MNIRTFFRRLLGIESKGVPERFEITDANGEKHVIHRGSVRHSTLSADQLTRISTLRNVLADAYPMTMDGWTDGFMRDADPESELQIIEACAVVYQRLTAQSSLSMAEKKTLYSMLCILSGTGPAPELANLLPPKKGLPDLETIFSMFREARLHQARP